MFSFFLLARAVWTCDFRVEEQDSFWRGRRAGSPANLPSIAFAPWLSTPSAFSGLSGLRACFSVSVLPSTGETAKRPPGVTNLLQLREAQPQCEALYDVGHVPYRLTLAGGPVPLSCRCDVAYVWFERCCSASECGREHGRKPEAIRVSAGVGALGTQFSSAPPLVLFCYYQSGVRASFYQRC